LGNFIDFNKTPVIIAESLKWVPQSYVPPSKNELENILTSWNKAFSENDIKTIDSLYLKGSEIKGKRREELYKKVKYLRNLNKHFALQPRDISILQENNNAVIIFDQIFTVDNNSFQGFYNKLILEKINNKWYVVDDAAMPVVPGKQLAQVNNTQKETKSNSNEDIRNLVKKWVTSWQSGNMKTYRGCYASNFQSRGMNLDAWVSHKTDVRQNSKNINIRIDKLQISAEPDIATAAFTQYYSSSILNSKSKKKLELRKIDNEWKIYREII
jgi:ketosteroid isomerase-like protein